MWSEGTALNLTQAVDYALEMSAEQLWNDV
jgi:hypothetical protein